MKRPLYRYVNSCVYYNHFMIYTYFEVYYVFTAKFSKSRTNERTNKIIVWRVSKMYLSFLAAVPISFSPDFLDFLITSILKIGELKYEQ